MESNKDLPRVKVIRTKHVASRVVNRIDSSANDHQNETVECDDKVEDRVGRKCYDNKSSFRQKYPGIILHVPRITVTKEFETTPSNLNDLREQVNEATEPNIPTSGDHFQNNDLDEKDESEITRTFRSDVTITNAEHNTDSMTIDHTSRDFNVPPNVNNNSFNDKNENVIPLREMGSHHLSSVRHICHVILCISSFLSLTLVAYHDVVRFPEYWHENIFHWIFGGLPCYIGQVITRFTMVFKDHALMSVMTIFQTYSSSALVFVASHCILHLIWSEYLEFNSPMPFVLYIDGYFSSLAFWIVIWYKFPADIRGNIPLRNKRTAYYGFELWGCSLPLQILVLLKIFSTLTQDLQWITAIMIAIQKAMNTYVMERFICNAVESDNILNAKGITTIQAATTYKIAVVILIGSKANSVTGYCILGATFLLNMCICLKVMRLHRQSVEDESNIENLQSRKNELLVKLMLNEIVESLIPIIFVFAFIVAYYGPNAKIIGNIQNDYWHFETVDEIKPYITGILYMAIVDLSSVVISLHLLWGFCRIDGLQFLRENIGRFGTVLLFTVFSSMNLVSI